jgi:hypothetical protein
MTITLVKKMPPPRRSAVMLAFPPRAYSLDHFDINRLGRKALQIPTNLEKNAGRHHHVLGWILATRILERKLDIIVSESDFDLIH